jgi:two-component system, LytTR family, sensor kinase
MSRGAAVMNGRNGAPAGFCGLTAGADDPIVARDRKSMSQRARIPGLLLFVIATAFGLSSAFQSYLLGRVMHDSPISHEIMWTLALNLIYWYIPALLAPVIMAGATNEQLGRQRWPVQVLVHVTGALAYSIVHTAVMMALRAAVIAQVGLPGDFPGWWDFTLGHYLKQLDWLLMTYLFLVGLAHALAYRRESEARALNAAQLETRLVEAQLQALQRQLHPHFLFNTLNTISGLIHSDAAAADTMIDRLGDLLRMTLHSSITQEVPLKDELDVLQKYLEIEQTRFGNRLRVSMHIQPETLDAQVPNLLLQPLVENAIRHGIAPNARHGWIEIHADRSDADLTLQIRDSGDGLPPERLMALNRGVGLENTRARLEHLYPSAFQFTFTNLDRGFCVTVRIPFQVAELNEPIRVGAA